VSSTSLSWQQIFGGDGGHCSADDTDPQVFYGEYVYLNIHRNTDGATTDDTAGDRYISGQFWNAITNRWDWKPAPLQIADAFNQRALFIAPFALDPNKSSRMLAGGESLWRTEDVTTPNTPTSGPSWSRIKPPSTSFISALAIAPGNSDSVWVGYMAGEIWHSANATKPSPTWSRVDNTGPTPINANRMCTRIFVSPLQADTILAVFGGFQADNVWRSEDGGATWTSIAGSLPNVPVRAVTIHPARADWFYVGTEVGVFASDDRGATWSPTNEGPASVSVDHLFWMAQKLVCVTHGRGLFEIDLAAGAAPAIAAVGPVAVAAPRRKRKPKRQ